MRTTICLALAALIAAATGALATPVKPDAASARAYVQSLYQRYQHQPDFGVFGDSEKQFFDASTLALLQKDEKLLNGDEGIIGADYVCVCQDPAGLTATVVTVEVPAPNQAKARIDVGRTGPNGRAIAHVEIDLAFEGGYWRIHDIHPVDEEKNDWGSLRANVTKEIQELSAGH